MESCRTALPSMVVGDEYDLGPEIAAIFPDWPTGAPRLEGFQPGIGRVDSSKVVYPPVSLWVYKSADMGREIDSVATPQSSDVFAPNAVTLGDLRPQLDQANRQLWRPRPAARPQRLCFLTSKG